MKGDGIPYDADGPVDVEAVIERRARKRDRDARLSRAVRSGLMDARSVSAKPPAPLEHGEPLRVPAHAIALPGGGS